MLSVVLISIPEFLLETCRRSPRRMEWLRRLPDAARELEHRWSLTLGAPFSGDDVSCSWVAPASLKDGTRAVLKLGMPHMEALDEIEGLRFWDGDPTVRLLEADAEYNAMLLERCEPGTALRALPEPQQDTVISGLLKRIWRLPPPDFTFRPLREMLAAWRVERTPNINRHFDRALVTDGLRTMDELTRTSDRKVLLATDLHAGNVLRARREPWLVIDPKPFVGDPAYDATQHLLNCRARLFADAEGTASRFADLLEVDRTRVRLWLFARLAIGSGDLQEDGTAITLARRLAP